MTENSYRVKFNSKAIDDLEEIYSYISGELFAGDAADDLLNRIESSIMRLKKLPYSCNYVADEFLKIKGYRKLVIDNYIVFYLIDEVKKQVVISEYSMAAKNIKTYFKHLLEEILWGISLFSQKGKRERGLTLPSLKKIGVI